MKTDNIQVHLDVFIKSCEHLYQYEIGKFRCEELQILEEVKKDLDQLIECIKQCHKNIINNQEKENE